MPACLHLASITLHHQSRATKNVLNVIVIVAPISLYRLRQGTPNPSLRRTQIEYYTFRISKLEVTKWIACVFSSLSANSALCHCILSNHRVLYIIFDLWYCQILQDFKFTKNDALQLNSSLNQNCETLQQDFHPGNHIWAVIYSVFFYLPISLLLS